MPKARLSTAWTEPAVALRVLAGAVDRAVARAGIERHRVAVRRSPADVIVRPRDRLNRRLGGSHSTCLGDIAVVVLLLEPAVVADTGKRQCIGRLHRGGDRRHVDFEISGLRRGEGVAPAALEQLYGRGRGRTEMVVGSRQAEMNLREAALEAEVAVEAPYLAVARNRGSRPPRTTRQRQRSRRCRSIRRPERRPGGVRTSRP